MSEHPSLPPAEANEPPAGEEIKNVDGPVQQADDKAEPEQAVGAGE